MFSLICLWSSHTKAKIQEQWIYNIFFKKGFHQSGIAVAFLVDVLLDLKIELFKEKR